MRNWFKSEAAIVAEIHDSFNTYGEKLLKEANELLGKTYETNRAERLRKLGFTGVPDVAEADAIKKNREEKTKLSKVIQAYSAKYPYRFITEEGAKSICEKYGLILGNSEKYIGTIPEKNLIEIENFKVNDEDCVEHSYFASSFYGNYLNSLDPSLLSGYGYQSGSQKNYDKKFRICAPQKDFNTQGMEVRDFKLVVKDPVVLFPVKHGYFIVSAWGPEASDEKVVNSKYN